MAEVTLHEIKKKFPFIDHLSFEDHERFKHHMIFEHYYAGALLMEEGKTCSNLFFILKGVIRIYKVSADGREVTLYRMSEGETCLITASCLMSQAPFNAIAQAETDVEIVAVPAKLFSHLLNNSSAFQQFIFENTFSRLQDVMDVVSSITFDPVQVRIAELLYKTGEKTGFARSLYFTHEQIAVEIGSSREVISRALHKPDFKAALCSERGRLKIHDYDLLKSLSLT